MTDERPTEETGAEAAGAESPSQIPAPTPGSADATDPPGREKTFDRHMLEALVCPVTRAALTYDAQAQELISRAAHLAFPIRDGIPIMLVDEARKLD